MTTACPSQVGSSNKPIVFRPLLASALAVMGGIVLGSYLPGWFYPAVAIVLGVGAVMGYAALRQRCGLLAPLLFCVVLGYVCIQPWLRPDLPTEHVVHYVDQARWRVSGVVVDHPTETQGRGRLMLEARLLERGQSSLAVTGKIAVSTMMPLFDIRSGDTVAVSGYLRTIRSFCNPGGFDYERFMALQGVRVRLFAQNIDLVRVAEAPGGWMAALEHLRQALLLRMASALHGYAPNTIAILQALILGERVGIGPDLQEAFNRSGVSHVLSISGLHIGMVAVVGFGAGFWILAWIPFLRRRGWVHRGAALLSLSCVLGYGGLSGLSAATQRAMLMTSVFLLTYWVGRRHDWINTLAVAALVIVVVFPPAVFMVSFQLSFAAVTAMLVGLRAIPISRPAPSIAWWHRWLSRIRASLWVSVLAILGTLPLVLHYFNLLSLVGPLTNLVVVPLTGMVVVPVGLLGVVCWPLSPQVAGWCWKIAALCLEPQCWLIEKIAAWPWTALRTVTPGGVEIVLYCLLLGLVLTWKRWGRWRRVGLAVLLAACACDVGYWSYQRYWRSTMTMTVVDVGQGSATLFELPGGYTVLVDGGGFGDNSVFDTGERIVAPFLWRKKIGTIDLIILTHPDSDHLNGLLYLLRHFKIGCIWSTDEPADSVNYRNWRQLITDQGIDHPSFQSLPDSFEKNGVVIEILAPVREFLQLRFREGWRDSNNSSMVLRFTMRQISILLPADITARGEEELMRLNPDERLRSTVMMVPHHGSRSSSTLKLLKTVQPVEALISAGWQNRFGFPHATVLERLRAAGCRIRRTDECGAIQIETDGSTYRVSTCRPGCR